MDVDFHYYAVGYLAKQAGFSEEESRILAYASQHVDDNTKRFVLNEGQDEYRNFISQSADYNAKVRTRPNDRARTLPTEAVPAPNRIYACFHFVPGDPAAPSSRRKDGKQHVLNTTPGGPNATKLLRMALETGDLHRIGVALHAFADSWAHQNFVGIRDNFNAVKKRWFEGFLGVLPNVGHAEAMAAPDEVGGRWTDRRLFDGLENVDNADRFLAAADAIYAELRAFKDPAGGARAMSAAVREPLEAVLRQQPVEQRGWWGTAFRTVAQQARSVIGLPDKTVRRCQGLFAGLAGSDYDPRSWLDEAVEGRNGKWFKREGTFERSHWREFQDAVRVHQECALGLFGRLLNQCGVALGDVPGGAAVGATGPAPAPTSGR